MRYRIEHPVPSSPLSSKIRLICSSDGTKLGQIFINKPETERLRAYIEAHDEVMGVLRGVGNVSKRLDCVAIDELEDKAEALIARIEGEEER